LRDELYNTSEYNNFTIYEPKQRIVSSLKYEDRIVHNAIINVIGTIFIKSFISQTFSCIKGRGILKGLNTLKYYLKDVENTRYCLKLDIKKFYHNINHDILKQQLRTKFKDKNLLRLLDNIVDSFPQVVPFGNLTSQYFGNFYLSKFDHWLKEVKIVKYYLRYCDDIIVLSDDKKYLHDLRREIQEYLKDNLKLELSKYQVFPVNSRGIDYLGYVTYHSHCKIRKSIKLRMINKLNKVNESSYYGWLKHGNCKQLIKKYKICVK
jgi:retron-type reverse transcriptase